MGQTVTRMSQSQDAKGSRIPASLSPGATRRSYSKMTHSRALLEIIKELGSAQLVLYRPGVTGELRRLGRALEKKRATR